jgi:hypothetical protein
MDVDVFRPQNDKCFHMIISSSQRIKKTLVKGLKAGAYVCDTMTTTSKALELSKNGFASFPLCLCVCVFF